jgi:hypothetical protein
MTDFTGDSFDSRSAKNAREEALETAHAILECKLGVLEGVRLLSTLAPELVSDWKVDPDFLVLAALDSETDDLPVGAQRKLWDPKALAARDKIVSQLEGEVREYVEAACRNIVRRFSASGESPGGTTREPGL